MLLLLQKYNLNVYYKPGKELLIADTLSRDSESETPKNDICKDEHIFNILANSLEKINHL